MACCTTDYDWCITQYAGATVTYTFVESDGSVTDLTGFDFKFVIRNSSGTAAITLTVGSGITVNTTTGVVTCSLDEDQTESLTAGVTYYADLRVTPDSGEPYYPPIRWVITVSTPNARP